MTLSEYLASHGFSGKGFALMIGVSPSTINRVLSDPGRGISLPIALLIEKETRGKVSPASFIPEGMALEDWVAAASRSKQNRPKRKAKARPQGASASRAVGAKARPARADAA